MHGYLKESRSLISKLVLYFIFGFEALTCVIQDAIEVQDPRISQTFRYETFIPGSMAPYSKSACEKLQTPWISDPPDEEIADVPKADDDLDVDLSTNIDDDDVYTDTVRWVNTAVRRYLSHDSGISHHSSGVVDILITGEVR